MSWTLILQSGTVRKYKLVISRFNPYSQDKSEQKHQQASSPDQGSLSLRKGRHVDQKEGTTEPAMDSMHLRCKIHPDFSLHFL